MLELNLRRASVEDAQPLQAIRSMEGVRENVLGLVTDRIVDCESYLRGLGSNSHLLVAEYNTILVGAASLYVQQHPLRLHCANLSMMVHQKFQGMGIGTKLLQSLLVLADEQLGIFRIDLEVFFDNRRAIKLYESFGFSYESTLKYAIIRHGRYADLARMVRFKDRIDD